MAQTLTLTQLQAAQNLITKGDLNGFYQYMSSMGYNYAGLADDVITDSYPYGTTANDYLINYAESQGVAVTPALLLKIETGLATAYIQTLEAVAKGSPTKSVSSDITFEQALDFHTKVFQANGLSAAAWTLDVPDQVLGQSAMDAYWNTLMGGSTFSANASLTQQMIQAWINGKPQAEQWCMENIANGAEDGSILEAMSTASPFMSSIVNAISPNPLISIHLAQFNLERLMDEVISTGGGSVSSQSNARV